MNSILKVLGNVLTFGVPLLIDVLARKKLTQLMNSALHCHARIYSDYKHGQIQIYLAHKSGAQYHKLALELDSIEFDR